MWLAQRRTGLLGIKKTLVWKESRDLKDHRLQRSEGWRLEDQFSSGGSESGGKEAEDDGDFLRV